MNERHILPAVITFAIALIAVGCGSGSDEPAPLSKGEFIKRADAVCAKGETEVQTKFAAYQKTHKVKARESKSEIEDKKAEIIETIAVPSYQKRLDDIAALGIPDGDEAEIEEFVDAANEGIENAEKDPGPVYDGTSKAFAKVDKIAEEYGFEVCG